MASNWSALWMCCVSLTAPCELDTWAGRGAQVPSSLGHMFQTKFPLKLLSPGWQVSDLPAKVVCYQARDHDKKLLFHAFLCHCRSN